MAAILAVDLNADSSSLAQASGWWFRAFALMQLSVVYALDKIGLQRTTSFLLTIGAVGWPFSPAPLAAAGLVVYLLSRDRQDKPT